jgi:peptidyl-prolyl cis-trans isomerase SDCCAG10
MEEQFNNVKFRIHNEFIQTTGELPQSVYGRMFKDEFHSRLRFSHRGLLAMVTSGPNTNQSHFLITLGPAMHMNYTNTIFGKVVGNTIYNLLKMGEVECVDTVPEFDVQVLRTRILANPFDDIIPRQSMMKAAEDEEEDSVKEIPQATKNKKNLALLSFDEEEAPSFKVKSSHDVLNDAALSSEKVQLQKPKQRKGKEPEHKPLVPLERKVDAKEHEYTSRDTKTGKSRLQELQEKAKNLAAELKQMDAPKSTTQISAQPKKLSYIQEMRQSYLTNKKAVPTRQRARHANQMMEKLSDFQHALKTAKQAAPQHLNQEPEETKDDDWECDLHFVKGCGSCRDMHGKSELEDDEGWMQATLKFKKVADDVSVNVFQPKVDDYTVIDPRQG